MTTTATQDWKAVLPPIFQHAVAPTTLRYAIASPWIANGYVYATDGKICLRMPVPSGLELPADPKLNPPPVDSLPWNASFDAPLSPPRDMPPPPEPSVCAACKGSGISTNTTCDGCGGLGEVECDMGHDHDCEECDGTGQVDCDGDEECVDCDGSGRGDVVWRAVAWTERVRFAENYVRLIYDHGGAISPRSDNPNIGKVTLPGGIDGLLMGIADLGLANTIFA